MKISRRNSKFGTGDCVEHSSIKTRGGGRFGDILKKTQNLEFCFSTSLKKIIRTKELRNCLIY